MFDTLVSKFSTQFATSKPHHLTSLTLVNIKQEKSEMLWSFIERFGKVALSIQNLSPEVALHQLVTALRPKPFSYSLCKRLVGSMDELRQRAAKFMQLEELRKFKMKVTKDMGVR